jgi:hypothetical protein
MENTISYIAKKENEELQTTLKEQLSHVLVLLPEANEDLLVHCLALIDEKERSRFVEMCKREEVINNKTLMTSILNMLVSFKTIADSVIAVEISEGIIIQKIPAITENLITDFREQIAELVVNAMEEVKTVNELLIKAQNNIVSGMKVSEEYVKNEQAVLETAYKARTKHLEDTFDNKIIELDKQIEMRIKKIELIMTKRANDEIQSNLLPFFKQAFGFKGIGIAIFVMTMTQLLHDGIKYLFFH